ncbi:hypothetical protein V1512DRAFT_18380 [Lipomyces arxii]|uniref:uncharacterized protein n=1 Tax=Lipomyces arxii TaxID=56418 RepID=UPI0034CDB37F
MANPTNVLNIPTQTFVPTIVSAISFAPPSHSASGSGQSKGLIVLFAILAVLLSVGGYYFAKTGCAGKGQPGWDDQRADFTKRWKRVTAKLRKAEYDTSLPNVEDEINFRNVRGEYTDIRAPKLPSSLTEQQNAIKSVELSASPARKKVIQSNREHYPFDERPSQISPGREPRQLVRESEHTSLARESKHKRSSNSSTSSSQSTSSSSSSNSSKSIRLPALPKPFYSQWPAYPGMPSSFVYSPVRPSHEYHSPNRHSYMPYSRGDYLERYQPYDPYKGQSLDHYGQGGYDSYPGHDRQ